MVLNEWGSSLSLDRAPRSGQHFRKLTFCSPVATELLIIPEMKKKLDGLGHFTSSAPQGFNVPKFRVLSFIFVSIRTWIGVNRLGMMNSRSKVPFYPPSILISSTLLHSTPHLSYFYLSVSLFPLSMPLSIPPVSSLSLTPLSVLVSLQYLSRPHFSQFFLLLKFLPLSPTHPISLFLPPSKSHLYAPSCSQIFVCTPFTLLYTPNSPRSL